MGAQLVFDCFSPRSSGYSDCRPLLAVLPSYELQYLKTENPHQQEKKSDNQRFFKVIVGRWCSKIPEEEKKATPETKNCDGHKYHLSCTLVRQNSAHSPPDPIENMES